LIFFSPEFNLLIFHFVRKWWDSGLTWGSFSGSSLNVRSVRGHSWGSCSHCCSSQPREFLKIEMLHIYQFCHLASEKNSCHNCIK
jgi:hypothetical protein